MSPSKPTLDSVLPALAVAMADKAAGQVAYWLAVAGEALPPAATGIDLQARTAPAWHLAQLQRSLQRLAVRLERDPTRTTSGKR